MSKKKILIIDDEKDFTKIIKLNLEETGNYEVREENSGLQGLTAAKEFKPDLILLDVMMPDIDGGDVFDQIRGDKETENIPIVYLTAIVNKKELEDRGGVIGGNPSISKPVSVEELVECIGKNIHQ